MYYVSDMFKCPDCVILSSNCFNIKINKVEHCITDLRNWMSTNKLKLNCDKTEVLKIGNKKNVVKFSTESMNIDNEKVTFQEKVRNLGVILDSELIMDDQISNLKKIVCLDLRRIGSVRPFLTQDACKQLVSSLMFSKLDYCNSMLFGATAERIKRLQVVQNNAARLVLGKDRRQEATPMLCALHWLPVDSRIKHKAATTVFKCLHNIAPNYLTELISPHTPKRDLRSTDECRLNVPRTFLKAGERSFSSFGPKVWNSLPLPIKKSQCLDDFKKKLKTFYFSKLLYQ